MTSPVHRSSLLLLRRMCLVEAITLLLLLFVAVPMKHLWGNPLGVSVMGPLHGGAFLLFAWLVAQAASAGRIAPRLAGRLMLAALLPLGGLLSWWSLR